MCGISVGTTTRRRTAIAREVGDVLGAANSLRNRHEYHAQKPLENGPRCEVIVGDADGQFLTMAVSWWEYNVFVEVTTFTVTVAELD